MGCANSKDHRDSQRNLNPPFPRSYSMPVHHPAERKGDSYHVVALTSSTYGILKMDPVREEEDHITHHPHGLYNLRRSLDRSSEMAARTWSEVNNLLQNYKPFKQHSKSPSMEEPETINTWELMEGLEDNGTISPSPSLHRAVSPSPLGLSMRRRSMDRTLDKSFSFHSVKDVEHLVRDERKVSVWHRVTNGVKLSDEGLNFKPSSNFSMAVPQKRSENAEGFGFLEKDFSGDSIGRPLWMAEGAETGETAPTLFDPDLISTFRKALDEISPEPANGSPVSQCSSEEEKGSCGSFSVVRSSSFRARLNSFQARIDESACKSPSKRSPVKIHQNGKKTMTMQSPPGGEEKVVFYFTSLRGIRKTFEDCCVVKMILQGFRVRVDERDISMHAPFREELQDLLGKPVTVPRLFIGGKYIGGVEEVQQLHEVGELANYLEGFPTHSCFEPCDACGDIRFVPCLNCDGSRKLFRENDGVIIRCLQCNENGLIRCPVCCS